ncbi:hypothetical protein BDV25DRAFT_171583 [Aspergillus avenaceus]|uniref:DUF7703 domain-containing protein n=1 Tax=Aspergillus avenaceus TaxID=36643 RepID=A0A5N6TDS1_ASPAV|nr:hypothetical protein BDV25DRAFT_171583 [Aspergillus avenaceus]
MTSGSSPGNGITGGYTGDDLGFKIAIATLAGVTWYNAIELIVLVFVTFSQYHGTYFWSLFLSSSVGLVPYQLGFLLKFFNLTSHTWLSVTFITVGWWCMVTGQSMVLYSRLHLVLASPRILRRVLAMIVLDAVLLHLPTTALTYGSNLATHRRSAWITGYNVMEKIQMTGFCIQEFVISGLYIWETTRMLRLDPDRAKRKIMYQLVAINLVIILMDLGLLVVEYKDEYIMETMIKGVVYSIKLKLEYAVLGKLVHLVRCHVWKSADSTTRRTSDFPDFVDASRVTTDLTHAAPTSRRRDHPYMDSDDVSIAIFEHSRANRDQETGHSEVSQSWSGDTHTNHPYPDRELSPVDFTNDH